ncbi:MAG: hypothetical protein HOW97_05295, partial [Catenulispora sp.]|nr:hypothetical protein [Catenulispora sp.]
MRAFAGIGLVMATEVIAVAGMVGARRLQRRDSALNAPADAMPADPDPDRVTAPLAIRNTDLSAHTGKTLATDLTAAA